MKVLRCHANQVTTGAVGEFDSINSSRGSDEISHVRDTGTGSCEPISE